VTDRTRRPGCGTRAGYYTHVHERSDERPGCPVRTECLQFALDVKDQWGVFGGLTAKERQRLKRGTAA
jgi:hypothetical protein